MKTFKFFLILVALLSACSPTAPTITIDTSTSVVDIPSPTYSIFTQNPEALNTPVSPTNMPTYTPPPPTPTISPQEIGGQVLTELTIDKEEKYSPDRGIGEWVRLMAFPTTESATQKYGTQFFTLLTLHGTLNGPTWVLVDKWQEWQFGYPVPDLLGWSTDNQYLYFYDSHIPDGCQPLGGFQQDLRRVDRNTGAIQLIPIKWTGGMTLSPDTTKVIYYDQQSIEVGIYDLNEGKEQRIPFTLPSGLDIWYAGEFTWSPDGQNALFIIQYGDPCMSRDLSLRRVNLANNQIIKLLEGEISILQWKDTNRVLISKDSINYWLDPMAGSVILAPECPNNCVITQPQ